MGTIELINKTAQASAFRRGCVIGGFVGFIAALAIVFVYSYNIQDERQKSIRTSERTAKIIP